MSTDIPDPTPSTSHSQPPTSPARKSSTSPPLADTVVRPFTSQGSTFGSPLQPLAYAAYPSQLERPSTAQDSPLDPPSAKFGPYISASARTSYTRVDVDSLPTPVYPPLPPLPTAFAVQNAPVPAPDVAGAMTPGAANSGSPADTSSNGGQAFITEPTIPQTPQVSLTFLLVSGRRKTQLFDPETTVGRVKELVWNAWPARDADWQDERPPAPSYFRILYLGRVLQDDETLQRVGFPTSLPSTSNATPTIVHLSIRPYGLPLDDPALSKKKRLSVAIGRRLSTAGVGVGVGARNGEHEEERDGRRVGCCTGCTIC